MPAARYRCPSDGETSRCINGRERIAAHGKAMGKHVIVTQPEHHRGIPLGSRREQKILIHMQNTAPVVEIRPLAAYESVAVGGGR